MHIRIYRQTVDRYCLTIAIRPLSVGICIFTTIPVLNHRLHMTGQGVNLDMISMLQPGEGALVGSTAKALCSLTPTDPTDPMGPPWATQKSGTLDYVVFS